MSCSLHNKRSDLSEAGSDTWAVEADKEFLAKSERQSTSSFIAQESKSAQRQFENAEYQQPSLQRRTTSASMVRNPLRKHKLPIYACIFCDNTFSRKGDWKRHEGSLHEPQREWCCFESGCNRKFPAGNKFRRHHMRDHGCENCKHDTDPVVISTTQAKYAWGCGFCIALLMSWDDRANHIALHFDAGSKRSDWDFSRVIQSLLRRPEVFDAWQSLLLNTHGDSRDNWPAFEWSVGPAEKLLESLQCTSPKQSATYIAQWAYDLGLQTKSGSEPHTLSPHNEFYPFPEPATAPELLANPLEPGYPIPACSNTLIGDNEAFQPGQPLITPALVTVDDCEVREALGDNSIFDEYLNDTNDYTTPCAETVEPVAWSWWPYPLNLPID